MTLLSVIIPAYNEERTIGNVLSRILAVPLGQTRFQIEIIVVDDGSTDNTFKIASSFQRVSCMRQENQGKGAAVQQGVRVCSGDYFLVQDADMEYDPSDYVAMLEKLPPEVGVAVYGSRILGQMRARGWRLFPGKHPAQGIGPWAVNILLSCWIFLLFRRWITDPLTAYKLYPTHIIRKMNIQSKGFEADHEITAKLIQRDVPIVEVPIRYNPRSVAQGKKIRAVDGLIALWTLFKYR